jgi:hypothetical protein
MLPAWPKKGGCIARKHGGPGELASRNQPGIAGLAWRTGVFAQQRRILSPTDPGTETIPSQIHGLAGWRRMVVWPLAVLVRLWGRSLRFEVSPEDLRNITKRDEPVAIILWHNRLFMAAEIYRRFIRGGVVY